LENGFIVTAAIPIYNKNIFKGLLTLNIESEYFGKDFNGKTSTKFFLLDKKNNVLPNENKDGGEISEFYKEIPEGLYEKRYKFQDMKPSTVVKIGKYYVYYKSFSEVQWKAYYITDNYQINKEIFEKNILFISMWLILIIILFEVCKRETCISNSKEEIKKLDRMLKKSNTELDKDFLTEASNRNGFIKIANFELSRMKRYDVKSSILMLDIDYFKKINDSYGHSCGDFILKSLVKIFMKNVRLSDVVCRWGGEEFLILLSETDYEGALLAGEKIRKVIERQEFHYHGMDIKVTITIGVSTLNFDKTLEHSIEQSDQALYSGKTSGRNRVVGYMDLEKNNT
jgi:diguanylate cyclase (GGDEF)-like protein